VSSAESSALRLGANVLQGKRPVFAMIQAVGTQAFIGVINILTGVITARMLGPEGRGIYTAVTTWPQLLATLAFAGLNSAVVFRMRKAPESVGRVAAGALLLGSAQCLVAIAAGFMLLPFFMGHYSAATVGFARLCLVSALVNSTYMLVKQSFAGIGAFKQFNLANLWPQLLYLVALLVMLPFGPVTPIATIVALLGTGALAVITTLPRFVRLVRPRLRGSLAEVRKVASFSTRAAAMDVVFALASNADRLVLIPLLPPGELGFYTVAFSFSRAIQLAQPAIASVVFSHMAGQSAKGGQQLHDHALRFLLAALVCGCVVLWLAGGPLLALTYGPEFAAANVVFRLLLVEAALGVLSQVTMQLFLARDRPGIVSTVQVIVLCVSVGALLVLVPRYGSRGAAAGLLLAGMVRWGLLLGLVRFALKLPPPRLFLRREDFQYLLGRLR
jgi:O-antigen/teichoic acid export membrane protein